MREEGESPGCFSLWLNAGATKVLEVGDTVKFIAEGKPV